MAQMQIEVIPCIPKVRHTTGTIPMNDVGIKKQMSILYPGIVLESQCLLCGPMGVINLY